MFTKLDLGELMKVVPTLCLTPTLCQVLDSLHRWVLLCLGRHRQEGV